MPIPDTSHGFTPGKFLTRLPSARALLLWLVLVCLLPAVIGAGVLGQIRRQHSRIELQNTAIQTAQILIQVVDGQLAKAELLAQALAVSESLARGDFAQFDQHALLLLQQAHIGHPVLLYDINGQPRGGTTRPAAQNVPLHVKVKQIERVFAGGRPVVAEVFSTLLSGRPEISIAVPVFSVKSAVCLMRADRAATARHHAGRANSATAVGGDPR